MERSVRQVLLSRDARCHWPARLVARALATTAIATMALATIALSGCTFTDQLRSHLPSTTPANTPAPSSGSASMQGYLDIMNGLGLADPARQADLFYEVEREFTRAPTTASTLRYAVALVTAGHPASSPSEGKRLLETLLATPERMTQEERTLAAVVLHETDVRLKLEAENRRLLATLDYRARSQANSEKRMQAQMEENTRLRRALNEAQQKLDAIKEIERSLIERSPTPPGRDATPSEAQSPPASR